jgi:hypothetical protein
MHYKEYIVIEKYRVKLFGEKVFYYNIILNNEKDNCTKPIILKKKKLLKSIIDKFTFLVPYFTKKIYKKKIYKKDKNSMKNIFKLFDKRIKYTYCLNKDNLLISTTINKKTDSRLKDLLSKHILLCNNEACCAGEMIFKNKDNKKYILFDNNSGSYKPTKENLLQLKKKLYYLNTKIKYLNF